MTQVFRTLRLFLPKTTMKGQYYANLMVRLRNVIKGKHRDGLQKSSFIIAQ